MAGKTHTTTPSVNYRKPPQRPKPKQPPAPSATNTNLGKVTGKEPKQ
jgi:hypothetical protein